METVILEILETAAITVSGFLIKKYVFLEPDMEAKKQHYFYLVSFFLIGIVFLAFGKDAATIAALLMIGFNTCLGRKKYRLCGLFLMIPFTGIINGLFCSGTACAAVFLCVVGTGDCRLSVHPLWIIDCIVFLVLCEREKLAQLVSREYAAQKPAKIREIFALGNRDFTYVFLQYG